MEQKKIISLENIKKEDFVIVGGKAYNLSILDKFVKVPKGVCITSEAFKEIQSNKEIKTIIEKIMKTDDFEEINSLSETIKKKIFEQKIDSKTIVNLKDQTKKIIFPVAVRSSAIAEDSETASFAGQQDSYLNVNEEVLVESIMRCFASVFNQRAIFYRKKKKINVGFETSVIIQEMVKADYAGVMFTLDPVNKKDILIEIVEGLGETLVSGEKTPNNYFLDKEEYQITDENILFEIDSNIIKKIGKIGILIEQKYKKPMDIEFAVKDNEIFILQARPITV